jgi:hypothetical protein
MEGDAGLSRVPLAGGAHSDGLTIHGARHFLELVPHAEFFNVAKAHHIVAGDDNASFGTVVAEFLNRRIRPRLEILCDNAL